MRTCAYARWMTVGTAEGRRGGHYGIAAMRGTSIGARMYWTWRPRALCRQRCAKNDGFSALLTARSYVRAWKQCRVNVVPRTSRRRGGAASSWRWSPCSVPRACPVPRRVRWVLRFHFLCVCDSLSLTDVHVFCKLSSVGTRCRPRDALPRSFAVRFGPTRRSQPALPYLAVHWQPSEKGNRENSKFPHSCLRSRSSATRCSA